MSVKQNKLKIIIAGGGTGGHIFPAIAIAQALQKLHSNIEFLFVGANGKMEMEKIPQAGFNIKGIDIAGFNRSNLLQNISLPFKLVKSIFQVNSIFKSFTPDAVIGVGGYSSFPVLRYAQSKKIPTFIHESNSFAGKANKMLGKKATSIYVASDGMNAFFPSEKINKFGNPIRKNIFNPAVNKNEAIDFFGLDKNKKTILSVGGSLGALSINKAIAKNINLFEANNLQLIWQTGKPFVQEAKTIAANKPNIWVNDFIKEMNMAYTAADIVISRSGAMALAEICILAKPALFVPYPFAAENHQTHNAMNLVNKNAALIITDKEAEEKLVNTIIDLSKDEKQKLILIENIKPLGINNADELIANDILNKLKIN